MGDAVREPTYLVLTALAGGRRHGYALLQEVAKLAAGQAPMRAGSLYAVLDRLLEQGLVQVDGEEVVGGRLRRYYVLSPTGTGELAEQTRMRRQITAVAARRLRALGVQA
jgi:DNA-binding PadR family transcriptional regulator